MGGFGRGHALTSAGGERQDSRTKIQEKRAPRDALASTLIERRYKLFIRGWCGAAGVLHFSAPGSPRHPHLHPQRLPLPAAAHRRGVRHLGESEKRVCLFLIGFSSGGGGLAKRFPPQLRVGLHWRTQYGRLGKAVSAMLGFSGEYGLPGKRHLVTASRASSLSVSALTPPSSPWRPSARRRFCLRTPRIARPDTSNTTATAQASADDPPDSGSSGIRRATPP